MTVSNPHSFAITKPGMILDDLDQAYLKVKKTYDVLMFQLLKEKITNMTLT